MIDLTTNTGGYYPPDSDEDDKEVNQLTPARNIETLGLVTMGV